MSSTLRLLPTDARGPAGTEPDRAVGELVLRVARARPAAEATEADASATAPELGPAGFLARRARLAVQGVVDERGRRLLARVLETHLDGGVQPDARTCALLGWAGYLESRGRLAEAARVLDLATDRRPRDPGLALHAARVARKSGDRTAALALYERVRDLDDGRGHLERMASVGCALLASDPIRALGRAIRRAVLADDGEAAAVAQEARARARRESGDMDGAIRDFVVAAARFEDPADVGRIGHALADLFTSRGDVAAARHALLETERRGHPEQVRRARSRLFAQARALGDEVGMRRWAEAGPTSLVSITFRAADPGHADSRADRLLRSIRRITDST